jgi:preprotein translocase subunit Sss1
MSELLKFNAPTTSTDDREILSTVKEAGVGAKILLSKANLLKEVQTYLDGSTGYNRVIVMLRKPDGSELKLVCSKTVSIGLRAKTITLKHLRNFPIGILVTKDGEEIPQIQMPNGAGFEEFGTVEGEVQEYQAETTNPEDFIAF